MSIVLCWSRKKSKIDKGGCVCKLYKLQTDGPNRQCTMSIRYSRTRGCESQDSSGEHDSNTGLFLGCLKEWTRRLYWFPCSVTRTSHCITSNCHNLRQIREKNIQEKFCWYCTPRCIITIVFHQRRKERRKKTEHFLS